ncbi:DUF1449 family protein [Paracrocinitomix mangrovi]|uniref:OB-fold-containig protein n=1 Tax=Paracrocinitomix mangrovi TaxID=2862509 RepID=UPI001C8D54EE|nr:OB-fold-containig protein [Paracrocinitomix mangrovi]UKN01918.1 DUF1449 family protein [Paracrocinitomix mangrovi]
MNEFFHHVFSLQNSLATFILAFCLVYWLIVILGAIDVDFFDFDVDVDTDVDVDVDGGDAGESGVAWFNKVLVFFNLGRVPFMVWLTIVAIPLWVGSIIISFLIHNYSFLLSLLYFIPLLIGSMLIAKPLTWPFVKMFDALEKDTKKKELVGRVGRVIIAGTGQKRGQIEISYEGSVITIYVKPTSEDVILQKNMEVLVISKDEDGHYLVEPYT